MAPFFDMTVVSDSSTLSSRGFGIVNASPVSFSCHWSSDAPGSDTAAPSSGGELHGDDVAVSHHVVAASDAQRPTPPRPGVAPRIDEPIPADDLRAHEAALDVGVHLAGGVPRGQPAAQVPRVRRVALAGGEERDLVEQRERLAHDAREARLVDAEVLAHRRGLLVVELGELRLDAGRYGDRA